MEKGVKTTYYLHMKPRHTAEQSTVRVNKGEALGKRGFAGVINDAIAMAVETPSETVASVVAASATAPAPANEPRETANVVAAKTPTSANAIQPNEEIKIQPIMHATEVKAVGFSQVMATNATTPPSTSTPIQPTAQPAKKLNIMPPSDPSEDTVCDSCQ